MSSILDISRRGVSLTKQTHILSRSGLKSSNSELEHVMLGIIYYDDEDFTLVGGKYL
jgi:hypothetical protein